MAFLLSAVTGLLFGWMALRGTGKRLTAVLIALLTTAFALVVPLIGVAFLAHLIEGDYRAFGDTWTSEAIIIGNLALWGWALWQRLG